MKKQKCISCNKTLVNQNEIGINKKLLGEKTTVYYCLRNLKNKDVSYLNKRWENENLRRPRGNNTIGTGSV